MVRRRTDRYRAYRLTPLFLFAASFFFSFPVHGVNASWLCQEESSQRIGDLVYSCGIGQGATENLARADAFNNAAAEFSRICDSSDDCRGRSRSLRPGRTVCQVDAEKANLFRCYRLLTYLLGNAPTDLLATDADAPSDLSETPNPSPNSPSQPETKTNHSVNFTPLP